MRVLWIISWHTALCGATFPSPSPAALVPEFPAQPSPIAKPSPTTTPDPPDIVETDEKAYANWLDKVQVNYKSCFPDAFHNQMVPNVKIPGLITKDDIASQSLILSVPAKIWLTPRAARDPKRSRIAHVIAEREDLFKDEDTTLAVFLMFEKLSNASFWADYIRTMPRKFYSTVQWTPQQMAFLDASPLARETNATRQRIQDSYRKVIGTLTADFPELFPPHKFVFGLWQWANLMVMSKGFSLVLEGKKTKVLIPLVDLLNHGQMKISWGFTGNESSHFKLYAEQDIQGGDQLLYDFGPLPNWQFLLKYGFALEQNENDNMQLVFPTIPESDPKLQAKLALLEEMGSRPDGRFILRKTTISPELLWFLRVYHMTPVEVLAFNTRRQKKPLDTSLWVSLENEVKAFDHLQRHLSSLLRTFNHTVADDTALLESGQLMDLRIRYAVLVRRADKEILGNIARFAKVTTEMLRFYVEQENGKAHMPYFKKRQAKLGEEYVKNTLLPMLESTAGIAK